MMPGLDGFQVIDYINGNLELARTKILVTSSLPNEQLLKAIAAGASDAMAKPFEPDELTQRIDALLAAGRLTWTKTGQAGPPAP